MKEENEEEVIVFIGAWLHHLHTLFPLCAPRHLTRAHAHTLLKLFGSECDAWVPFRSVKFGCPFCEWMEEDSDGDDKDKKNVNRLQETNTN